MGWKAYRVTVTRLIEEECHIYVRAADEAEAANKALEEVSEIAEGIWIRTDCEPHTYSVEECKEADKPKEFT